MLPKVVLRLRKVVAGPNRFGSHHEGAATERAWHQMLARSYRQAAARETGLTELAAALDRLRANRA